MSDGDKRPRTGRAVVWTASPVAHLAPALRAGGGLDGDDDRAADADAVALALAQALAARPTAVELADGDPLLRAEVLDWLASARGAGVDTVAVTTLGHVLGRPGAAEALAEAGLSHAIVPLFGADAAGHDWVAGVDGAFTRALRGLKRARRAGVRTRVIVPLLRPTFRGLAELVRRCLAIGVGGFRFVAVAGPDRPAQGLLPHPALAAPHLRRALDVAAAARRPATVERVPLCLLGDHARRGRRHDRPAPVFDAAGEGDRPQRDLGPPCEGCPARAPCGGPLASHVGIFGWEGLDADALADVVDALPG